MDAKERYNKLMFSLALEYLTIGTDYTDEPERRNKWNLRDIVSEVQYQLDRYKDPDCSYYQDAHDGSPDAKEYYKIWRSDIGKMERFINRYKDEALTMRCTEGHCSEFDND